MPKNRGLHHGLLATLNKMPADDRRKPIPRAFRVRVHTAMKDDVATVNFIFLRQVLHEAIQSNQLRLRRFTGPAPAVRVIS